ncbi:MAG: succinate dehydrogenase assembly factor 2 [Burkholderiaceae bacterium]
MGDESSRHQADPVRRRRLRWRARRGLLENDLVLKRFFERHEQELSDDDVIGLDHLLDLPDNELLDLILNRKQLASQATPHAARVLQLLRSV